YNALILERLTVQASAKGTNVALKALNDRIDIVKSNLLTALSKQKETSEFEINKLRQQYAQSKSKLETVPGIEREYVNIMRQQTLKEQLYTYLLRQREETELAIAGAHPRGVIIDEAFVSDPEMGLPGKAILAIFILLGLIIPAAIFILRWNIANKVALNEQAESLTGFPTIVDFSETYSGKEPVLTNVPASATAAQYRLLRSNFLSTLTDKSTSSIVTVAGTTGDDNSAIAAINFAASLALTGRKVLLVDADFNSASVATLLNLKAQNNLARIASGTNPEITDILLSGNDKMSVITGSSHNHSGADAVASINFSNFVREAGTQYDFVIINAPQGNETIATVESLASQSDVLLVTYSVDITAKRTLSHFSNMCHNGKPAGYLISFS
ncbi:MAG: AAA family ATPase, partial [Muribaculaceae bacterium]|nr:AAA family ATPase [Muribaculaceae bacterium]